MTDDEWNIIQSKLKIIDYKKNDIILNIDEVCDKLRFINSGITRMYYFNENAKEFTCHISFNDSENLIDNFSIDFHSFSTKTPTIYEIEALKDTQIIELCLEDLNQLSFQTKVLEELSTKASLLIHSTMRDGLISKNVSDNTQRYEEFIKRYKPIYNKIPQYIIASYLGITPVGLSKLINK